MNTWPTQRIVEIADGIIAVLNGDGEIGVANAACALEGEHAFVIDTMTFPQMGEGLANEIARRGAHVDIVLNTHHHIDHHGGNMRFNGAQIVSQLASIRALRQLGHPTAQYDTLMPQFRGRFHAIDLIYPEPISDRLLLPRRGQFLFLGPAHTVADTAVWFPGSRVLVAGDLSFIRVTPLAVNGLLSGWIEALDRLIALDPEIVVPGHGPLGSVRDLLVLREYLASVSLLGQQAVANGLRLADALATFDAGPVAEWIEADRTALNLERAMQEALGEVSRSDVSSLLPSIRQRRPPMQGLREERAEEST